MATLNRDEFFKTLSEIYPTVTLVLMDTDGNIYENKHLTTAYQPEE